MKCKHPLTEKYNRGIPMNTGLTHLARYMGFSKRNVLTTNRNIVRTKGEIKINKAALSHQSIPLSLRDLYPFHARYISAINPNMRIPVHSHCATITPSFDTSCFYNLRMVAVNEFTKNHTRGAKK